MADLYRVGPDVRSAEVAYAIDGWPMALRVQLGRDDADGRWRIIDVEDPGIQQARLELLAETGLPSAPSARPWRGGLSARDAVGRPTATVLMLAWRDTVEVDGIILQRPREGEIVSAVEGAVRIRSRLAADAHATYTPQVAIALESRAPAGRLAELISAAEAGGVQEHLLVVRGPRGAPALMPLAREADAARRLPPAARLTDGETHLTLTLGEAVERVPHKGPGVDRDALREALNRLIAARPELAGVVVQLWARGDHGYTVRLLDALRAAAPQLALVTRAP